MKAKIILYGWVSGWPLLLARIETVEQAEFGSMAEVIGWLLFLPWFVCSLLLIKNERECGEEAKKIEQWFDKFMTRF